MAQWTVTLAFPVTFNADMTVEASNQHEAAVKALAGVDSLSNLSLAPGTAALPNPVVVKATPLDPG